MSIAVMKQALEALEHEKRPWDQPLRDAAITALRERLARQDKWPMVEIEPVLIVQPERQEQEPWSTRERFYEHIDRAVENMRQRMQIRTVTMRCPDFDRALPIIDAMEGHLLVGPATAPQQPAQQPLTDEQIEDEWERITGHSIFGGNRADGRTMYISPDEVIEFARAVEAAHGIGEKK